MFNKLSRFKKGHIPWNKGKKGLQKHTQKWKDNMSKIMKGRKFTPEWREKISLANKGNISWRKGIKLDRIKYPNLGHLQKHTEKSKEKMRKNHPKLRGKKSPHWKGGTKIVKGYIYIYNPNHPFCTKQGYVHEHRLIVEQQIGRYLLPEEQSHHLNKIKDDNRPENLMAFSSNSAHQRFHHNPYNVKPNEIIFDGRKLIHNN